MFEIAISPKNRSLIPYTRYDVVAGRRFDRRERAEGFCRELNYFCYQERFLVVRVGKQLEFPRQTQTPELTLAA